MSLRTKGIPYKSYVRSSLNGSAKCWAIRVEDEAKLMSTEMKMLHMLCGKTLKDKVSNEKRNRVMDS